jgi:hypothetical protein
MFLCTTLINNKNCKKLIRAHPDGWALLFSGSGCGRLKSKVFRAPLLIYEYS